MQPRWWNDHWPLVFQLEHHAIPLDPFLQRAPATLMDTHPGLRRYLAARRISPADVMGWTSEAEGPWRQRRLVALFLDAPWTQEPAVLCLDGPTDSAHRNGELELCLYYGRDPAERRWKVSDGLICLFDIARQHVWSEHIWRSRGRRPSDWPTDQAPHGNGTPAAPQPDLALPPVLNLTADGRPTGVPYL